MSLSKFQKSKEWLARNESPPLSSSTKEQFALCILKICTTIGINQNNIPKGLILDNLYDFCIENLKSYTLNEYYLAFNYYASNKLPFGDDHFQNLSPMFVSKVMKAYTEYLFNSYKTVTGDYEEIKGEDVKKALNHKGKMSFIDMIITDIEKQNVSIISLSPLYDLLKELEYIKIDNKQKAKIYSDTKKEYIKGIVNKVSKFKTKKDRDEFKVFCKIDFYYKSYFPDQVSLLIKYNFYKNFVISNKNINLEELKKQMITKLNEFSKNS